MMIKHNCLRTELRQQSGFTLIEIMISLVISSVLIGGVFSTFISTKQTERFAQALSRMQESGRFGVDYLAREIRMIGFRGCASSSSVNLNVIAKNAPLGGIFQDELLGFEVTSDNWAAGSQYVKKGSVVINPKLHSDIINIRRSRTIDTLLGGNLEPDNANIKITADSGTSIKAGDLLIVSDCIRADLFAATSVTHPKSEYTNIAHGASGNIVSKLSGPYGSDARVYKFTSISYFVADTDRKNNNGESVYALYQASDNFDDATFNSQEIIEGVENMQILYGVRDISGNVNYLNATAVSTGNDWANVATIKLGLMLTSNEGVRQSTDSSSYQLLDIDIGTTGNDSHETDKRLRQIYTSSIVIRNRQ